MRIGGFILTLLLILTGIGELYASHISGAEITYKHLFGNTYQFNLKVYRDCRECKFNNSGGGDNSTNCNDVPDLVIKGALGTSYASTQLGTIETSRKSIKDMTNTCNSGISKCRPGSNIPVGFEEHLFEGVFNFNDLINDGYCKFDISISMFSRSVNINTLMSEQTFFNYAMINLCESQSNESVEYRSSPNFFHTLSQSNYFSLNASNTDKDSLAFSLKPALVNRGLSISYALGRNSDAPFSYYCLSGGTCQPNLNGNLVEGFYCSPATGDLAFTPTQVNQGGVIVIECEEWKKNSSGNYYLAGVTRRDVYGDVVSSNNNLPVIKNKILNYTICEGNRFSLEINVEDLPLIGLQNDTVHAFIESPLQGASLDKIPVSYAPYFRYVLNVDPTLWSAGNHTICIRARDNHCPLNGLASKTFTLTILKARNIKISSSVKKCGNLEVSSTNFSNKNIYWTLKDNLNNVIKQQFNRKLNVQLPSGGTYQIEAYLPAENGYCEVKQTETIVVADFKTPVMDFGPDFSVCKGVNLNIQPRNFATFDAYKVFADGKLISDFPLQLNAQSSQIIEFRVEQDNGCFAEDKLSISLHPVLNYKVSNDTVCVNDVFPIEVKNLSFDKAKVSLLDYTYSSPASTLERVNAHIWKLDVINYTAHRMELYSLIQDKNACFYLDTSHILFLEPEPINVVCPDKICINAAALPLQTRQGGSWECVNFPALLRNNTLYPDSRTSSNLILKYSETRICTNAKTFYMQPLDTTPISFVHDNKITICENNGLFELKGLPAGGTWTGENVLGNFFVPQTAAGKTTTIKYNYKNTGNCTSVAPVSVFVEKLPSLKVIADKPRVCLGDVLNLQALSSLNATGYWYTEGEGSFDQPVSANTSYRPSAADVNKGPLKFTYTLQTNGVCGNLSSEVYVSVKVGPNGKIIADYSDSICEPASFVFKSDFKRIEKQYWFINDSLAEEFDYNFNFTPVLKAGTYVIKTKVYDSTCEALAISENITVLPKPALKMISNPQMRISREYPRLYLKDLSYSRSGHTVNWYFNNNWISDSREFYYTADDGKDSFYIKLVATSNLGSCKDSSTHLFVFIPINQLYIPDAFSPDAKGPEENNKFRVQGPPMKQFEIEIFNKYGEKVFVSDTMDQAWDGTYKNQDCMQGVYFYKIITTDYEGINRDYSGTLTLIR